MTLLRNEQRGERDEERKMRGEVDETERIENCIFFQKVEKDRISIYKPVFV